MHRIMKTFFWVMLLLIGLPGPFAQEVKPVDPDMEQIFIQAIQNAGSHNILTKTNDQVAKLPEGIRVRLVNIQVDTRIVETSRSVVLSLAIGVNDPIEVIIPENESRLVGDYFIRVEYIGTYFNSADSDEKQPQRVPGQAVVNVLDIRQLAGLDKSGADIPEIIFKVYSSDLIERNILEDMIKRKLRAFPLPTGGTFTERVYYNDANQSFIVEARPKTHQQIEQLIEQLSAVTANENPATSGKPKHYRIEVLLLQSGARESSGEVAKLEFSRERPLQGLNCEVGQMVGKGEVLAQLDMSEVAYDIQQTKTKLASAVEQFKLQETIIETMKQQFEAGRATQIEINQKLVEFRKAQENIEELENQLERVLTMRDNYLLTAPFDGKVTRIHRYPGQMAKGTILELSKIDTENPTPDTSSTASLLEKYGLTEDAFLPFEMDDLILRNRTVIDLYPEGNRRASVSLPSVDLNLNYINYQTPFLIAQVQFSSDAKPNSRGEYVSDVFLEPNKSGIVGFTNLDDATVLVLYWRHSGELPESDVSQRDSLVELSREQGPQRQRALIQQRQQQQNDEQSRITRELQRRANERRVDNYN